MFVVLSAGMLTALTATTMSLAVPAFAGGDDHHDNGAKKKCKDNGDNNCNDKHKTQKIEAKNKCETENENKDHSKKNDNFNELACVNIDANLNDVFAQIGSTDGNVLTGLGTDVAASTVNNTQAQQ